MQFLWAYKDSQHVTLSAEALSVNTVWKSCNQTSINKYIDPPNSVPLNKTTFCIGTHAFNMIITKNERQRYATEKGDMHWHFGCSMLGLYHQWRRCRLCCCSRGQEAELNSPAGTPTPPPCLMDSMSGVIKRDMRDIMKSRKGDSVPVCPRRLLQV